MPMGLAIPIPPRRQGRASMYLTIVGNIVILRLSHVRSHMSCSRDHFNNACTEMKLALGFLSFLAITTTVSHSYYVGTGRYDITGPAAEINMVR